MADKIEILQKLIALANNNPNDNEANLAARKVCKMLVELKINFINRKASDKVPPSHRPSYQQYDPFNDIAEMVRQMKREEEEYRRRAAERESYTNPYTRKTYEGQNPYQTPPGFAAGWERADWGSPFTYNPKQQEPKPKKEKVSKKCSDCGKPHMTRYEGDKPLCNGCQWRRHNEEQAKKSHKVTDRDW